MRARSRPGTLLLMQVQNRTRWSSAMHLMTSKHKRPRDARSRRHRNACAALLCAAMLAALPAAVAGQTTGRFYAPGVRYPGDLATGLDGRVWFTYGHGVGAMAPDGRVTLYRLPGVDPNGLAVGPDGAVWVTDVVSGGVVRRDLSGAVHRYPAVSKNEWPFAITVAPDGNVWYGTEGKIVNVTPAGASIPYRLKAPAEDAWALTSGADGAVWFTWDFGVGRITTSGEMRLWKLVKTEAFASIAAGPDGALWLGDMSYRSLVRVTVDGRVSRVRAGPFVQAVTAGPAGDLWFSYSAGLGRVATDGTGLRRWPIPFGQRSDCDGDTMVGPDSVAFDGTGALWASDGPSLIRLSTHAALPSALEEYLPARGALAERDSIARGRNGAVWISSWTAIVRVDPDGQRRVFRRGVGHPGDMVAGKNGSVWYTTDRGINRLSRTGHVRRYRHGFDRRSALSTLTRGPDGNLWFVDRGHRAIGRMTPTGRVRLFSRGIPRTADLRTITSDGRRLWIADASGALITVTTAGKVRRITRGLDKHADPLGITLGPDRAIWFTEFKARRIGRIDRRGHIREYPVQYGNPASITRGPDGALWFTTAARDSIGSGGVGRIALDGRIDMFHVHTTCRGLTRGLISGPDGKLWFIEPDGPIAVGRLDPNRLIATGALPLADEDKTAAGERR